MSVAKLVSKDLFAGQRSAGLAPEEFERLSTAAQLAARLNFIAQRAAELATNPYEPGDLPANVWTLARQVNLDTRTALGLLDAEPAELAKWVSKVDTGIGAIFTIVTVYQGLRAEGQAAPFRPKPGRPRRRQPGPLALFFAALRGALTAGGHTKDLAKRAVHELEAEVDGQESILAGLREDGKTIGKAIDYDDSGITIGFGDGRHYVRRESISKKLSEARKIPT